VPDVGKSLEENVFVYKVEVATFFNVAFTESMVKDDPGIDGYVGETGNCIGSEMVPVPVVLTGESVTETVPAARVEEVRLFTVPQKRAVSPGDEESAAVLRTVSESYPYTVSVINDAYEENDMEIEVVVDFAVERTVVGLEASTTCAKK
jgi:hypothetical protein